MNPLPNPYDNDADTAVRDLLADNGINYQAVLTAYDSEREGWRCDSWLLMLSRGGKSASFEYHTGVEHRAHKVPMRWAVRELQSDLKNAKTSTVRRNLIRELDALKHPVVPSEAALLHSVMLDADAAQDTFENFCYECGYNPDSRKALDLYLACQQNGIKLRSVIPTGLLAKLSGLLADY